METFYALVLFAHSAVRWIALVAAAFAAGRAFHGLLRGREWVLADARAARVFVGSIDLQLVLGLVLYFVASPIAQIARRDFSLALREPVLFFFGILHPVLALAAFVVAHAAWILARRAEGSRARFRRLAVGAVFTLAAFAILVPWPTLRHGRPLVRTEVGS